MKTTTRKYNIKFEKKLKFRFEFSGGKNAEDILEESCIYWLMAFLASA